MLLDVITALMLRTQSSIHMAQFLVRDAEITEVVYFITSVVLINDLADYPIS